VRNGVPGRRGNGSGTPASRRGSAPAATTMRDCGVADPTPEERGREALRRVARTWLHGAGATALELLPTDVEIETREQAISAVEECVVGLLAPLNALCAVDDEAAEALGVLLYKALHAPPEP
jgi:hypothetical protein